ncbi:MAG TPA: AI-2E family transporter [Methylomirabilota bacterium]
MDRRAARVVWTVLVFAAALGLLYLLRAVLLLFAFGLFFAYLIFPLVRLAQRVAPLRRHPTAAIALVYAVLLFGLVAAGAAVGPRLVAEATLLAQRLPAMSDQIQSGELVGNFLERRGWDAGRVSQVERVIREHAGEVTAYAPRAVAAALKWLSGAWTIVLVPVFAFFFLKDCDRFADAVAEFFRTRPGRDLWRRILDDVHHLLGHYVRALILLALITFVVWSAVLYLAGAPYAILLAAVGGALEFVPVVGPALAGLTVFTVSVFGGYGHPWLILGFVVLWRFVQDYVTGPWVMGGGIELHPALIIFGVIAGGEIAGPVGMFLSVPVIAAIRIVWRRLRAYDDATDANALVVESGESSGPVVRRGWRRRSA